MIKNLFFVNLASLYNSLFSGSRKKKNTSKLKLILISLLVIYILGSLSLTIGLTFYALAKAYVPAGLSWVYFANVGIMAFVASVIFSVFISQSLLFEAKDNDLLLSMPIPPSQILGSRMLVLTLFEFTLQALFMLIAGIVYAYVAQPPVLYYLYLLLALVFSPLLGLSVTCFFGFLVSLITSRMRNKSFFVMFVSLGLFGLYLWGYASVMSNTTALFQNGESIGEAIRKSLPMFYYLGLMLGDCDFFAFLYFALWCVIPLGFVYWLLSIFFIRLATTKPRLKKIEYKEEKAEVKSCFLALLNKEFTKFFNSPMYMLNCGISFLMNLVLGGYFLIKGTEMVERIFQDFSGAASFITPALTASLCFTAMMGFTTAPSISLEGKNLWILKSSPIPVKEVFHAKIALNLILGLSTQLFALFCIAIKLKPSLADLSILLLVPAAIQVLTALIGLICNLFFPKFDFTNETMVVKQSASVLVSMLVCAAYVMALVLLYLIAPKDLLPFNLFAYGAFLLTLLVDLVAYRFLMRRGVEIFEGL